MPIESLEVESSIKIATGPCAARAKPFVHLLLITEEASCKQPSWKRQIDFMCSHRYVRQSAIALPSSVHKAVGSTVAYASELRP